MALVKQILDRHLIEISIHSELGKGTTFVIDAIDGRVLKRIHSHEKNEVLVLKSDNEIYEP